MKHTSWLAGLAGVVTLGLAALPAQAAPSGGLDALKGAAPRTADVQKAHWDSRRYRNYGYRPYYYNDYYDRPGFRFYYGPRYHHRHHRNW
jgi:hypothetical protein